MDIYVSGGRTTPVTLVVATGQNVRFVNADPFDHQLYDVKGEGGGMAPEPTKSGEQRIWQPQKAGVYEIRDKLFPSVRSWIVVADNVVSQTHPKRDGSFTLGGLVEGSYTLQAYHEGQKTGEPMPIEVRGLPDLQPLIKPLVVAKKGDKPEKEIGEEGDE